jgi:hypothetical protein
VTDTETPASNADTGVVSSMTIFAEGSAALSTITGTVADLRVVLRVWMLIRLTLFRRQGLLGET